MNNEEKISRTPPKSKKVYIDGEIHPIKSDARNFIGRY
jgi:hypothetical protein